MKPECANCNEGRPNKRTCSNCYNGKIYVEEEIIWCLRYDCNVNEVAKEIEEPSCWETMSDHDARRFAVCWECKNFWWAFPLRPTVCNGCTKGKEIPCREASEECSSFEPIDKNKK